MYTGEQKSRTGQLQNSNKAGSTFFEKVQIGGCRDNWIEIVEYKLKAKERSPTQDLPAFQTGD